jgi:hypothetical protein
MIFCENCKHISKPSPYLYVQEYGLQKRIFVEPDCDPVNHSKPEYVESPICNHAQCFETSTKITPVTKLVTTFRFRGQAQLNKNNDCKFFELKPAPKIEKSSKGGSVAIVEAPKQKPWYKFWT